MGRGIVRILVLTLAVLVVLGMTGCGSGGETVTVGEAEAGENVNLVVGQQMEIALASNPTTGYSWQVADDAGGIVEMVGEPEFIQDPGPTAVGRGGAERLTFRAKKAGSGTLVLEYSRPWEKDTEAEKSFEIPIVVK